MVRWFRRIIGSEEAPEEEQLLSPSCDVLVSSYDFEAGEVLSIHADIDHERVVVEFDLPLLETHPSFSRVREVRRRVTATFHGVVDPSLTKDGKPLVRGRVQELEYGHVIDEFYISATCPWQYRVTDFHAHVLWCIAEGLVLTFPFSDVRCAELLDEDE